MGSMQNPLSFNASRFVHQVVKVPSMGDSISEGTVQEYVKKIGDFV